MVFEASVPSFNYPLFCKLLFY